MEIEEYLDWFRENAEKLDSESREAVYKALELNQLVNVAKKLTTITEDRHFPSAWKHMLEKFFWEVY